MRSLVPLWAILGATPLLLLLERGPSGGALLTLGLWFLEWPLLLAARARDPDGVVLRSLTRSIPTILFVAVLLLLLPLIILTRSPVAVCCFGGGAVILLTMLWLLRSAESVFRRLEPLILSLATVAVLLVTLEVVLRLPPVVERTAGYTPGMLRWEATQYDRLWEQSPLRLRSLHVDLARRNGFSRAVVLGDSFTWGDKLARTEDLWPFVAERSLQASGHAVEMVSLARNGYTTVNQAEALDRFGWGFDPDLVLLQFFLNDPLPSGPGFQHETEDWLFRPPALSPIGHRVLDRRSYLYSFLNAKLTAFTLGRRHTDGYRPLFDDDFDGWSACRNALRRMATACAARGVPFVVIMHPDLKGSLDDATYPYLAVHRKVADVVEKAGAVFLDLRPHLAARSPRGRDWWGLPANAHPSEEGHRVVGEAVAGFLLEHGLVPSPDVAKN